MDEECLSIVSLHAENVGGINETNVKLSTGATVLAGRNATNHISFLQAVMTAMRSDETSLKGDAEAGVVELEMGDETCTAGPSSITGGVITARLLRS